MIRVERAAWVLPVAGPPIRDGWVALEDGQVADLGSVADMPAGIAAAAFRVPGSHDHRASAILPGLVNAHAHLELSWMRGKVPPRHSMPEWVSVLIALRRNTAIDPLPAIESAISEARAAGTTLFGDVANTSDTQAPLARSGLSAIIFRELIGFRVDEPAATIRIAQAELDALPDAQSVRSTLAPHAPYSVSPALLTALATHAPDRPLSVHLGESAAELEFLQSGAGPWRSVLESVGAWNPAWQAPCCGPVEYMERLGLLNARLLAVHCVQLNSVELSKLARAGATIVTCPRSNQWTGAGVPPIQAFYDSGTRVAIGTDSLASVETLSMFDEMLAVRRLAPQVPARRILRSATLDGAAALGFADLGSIERGKRATLLTVRVPSDLADVEEYLVGGVPASDVGWL
jgi:aminodeoxyfutalosine deaminase